MCLSIYRREGNVWCVPQIRQWEHRRQLQPATYLRLRGAGAFTFLFLSPRNWLTSLFFLPLWHITVQRERIRDRVRRCVITKKRDLASSINYRDFIRKSWLLSRLVSNAEPVLALNCRVRQGTKKAKKTTTHTTFSSSFLRLLTITRTKCPLSYVVSLAASKHAHSLTFSSYFYTRANVKEKI